MVDDSRLPGVVWDAVKAHYASKAGEPLTPATPISAAELKALIEDFRRSKVWVESDLSIIHNLEVQTLKIGLSNVVAFAGIGGPYWTDRDGDRRISFTDDAGTALVDGNGDGYVDVVVGTDGRAYGDVNRNGAVDTSAKRASSTPMRSASPSTGRTWAWCKWCRPREAVARTDWQETM